MLELTGTEYFLQKGSFLAAQHSVELTTKTQNLTKGLFSGEGFFVTRVSGSGTLRAQHLRRPDDLRPATRARSTSSTTSISWPGNRRSATRSPRPPPAGSRASPPARASSAGSPARDESTCRPETRPPSPAGWADTCRAAAERNCTRADDGRETFQAVCFLSARPGSRPCRVVLESGGLLIEAGEGPTVRWPYPAVACEPGGDDHRLGLHLLPRCQPGHRPVWPCVIRRRSRQLAARTSGPAHDVLAGFDAAAATSRPPPPAGPRAGLFVAAAWLVAAGWLFLTRLAPELVAATLPPASERLIGERPLAAAARRRADDRRRPGRRRGPGDHRAAGRGDRGEPRLRVRRPRW